MKNPECYIFPVLAFILIFDAAAIIFWVLVAMAR